MIEVIVLDVVARGAVNQEVKWPSDAYGRDAKLGLLRVILLKERAGGRILPIWVYGPEGDVIAMQLEHVETPRPSTFDLTTHLLELSGAKIERVAVTELRNNVYIGTTCLTRAATSSKSMRGRATRSCSRFRPGRRSTSLPRYWRRISR